MPPLQYISCTGMNGSEGMCILNLMKPCLIAPQNASTSPLPLEVHEGEKFNLKIHAQYAGIIEAASGCLQSWLKVSYT